MGPLGARGTVFPDWAQHAREPGWTTGFDLSPRFTGPDRPHRPCASVGQAERWIRGTVQPRLWWAADGSRAAYPTFSFEEPAPVPEPGTMVLLASGLVLLAGRIRSRKTRTAQAEGREG